jgi:protein-S-isoprenylcysteine O-methyltransferase Ste14
LQQEELLRVIPITLRRGNMKKIDRLSLIKEALYYVLGIILIAGFVYLYWPHFRDGPGPPAAQHYLMTYFGDKTAVAVNASVFILFILFLPFRDRIEWRSKGMFSAFILALFAEMFGVPLLIFLLQPLGADYRLWDAIGLGQITNSAYYFSRMWPTRPVGVWMTLIGMLLVFFGWMKIHKSEGLVTNGIYRYIRHPQYTGIFLIITGWMFRWLNPTIIIMYPILLILYYRLARREERQVLKEYGDAYLKYKESTPMFFPIKLPSRRKEIAKQTR